MYGSEGYETFIWSSIAIIANREDRFTVNYLLGMEFTPSLSSLRLSYYANSEHRC